MTHQIKQKALVLGATGGIGGETAIQLRDAGWQVRAMHRNHGPQPQVKDGIEWVGGDAMNAADVAQAAEGCAVIVHAVNPPGYRNWAQTVVPMIDHTIAAAGQHGATVVLPGTVYNFGPDAFPLLSEDSPQHPTTRKGAIRVTLEKRLQDAAAGGAIRVVILRAGDFFGPRAGNNWLAQGMLQPGKPVTSVKLPARAGVGHQFAYLPDMARTLVELLARRDELPAFARFHLGGHWDADGSEIGRAIQRVVQRHGGKQPRLSAFPWWMMQLIAPFVTTLREIMEMRYLWQQPVQLNNRKLVEFLGAEPHTPLDEAIETTLLGLGCIQSAEKPIPKGLEPQSQTARPRPNQGQMPA